MGVVICDVHGRRSNAHVSPAVARAVRENQHWLKEDLCDCLDAWLSAHGIENEYTAEEQRFLRMASALANTMRPRLERSVLAIHEAAASAAGAVRYLGWAPERGCPFTAYAGSSGQLALRIEVRDRGDHLTAAVVVAPNGASVPEPLRIDFEEDALGESGLQRVAAWADDVARALHA